jgi:hypothetical protein
MRSALLLFAFLPIAAHAQTDTAELRKELELLRAEQAKTNERITRIETALNALEGKPQAVVPSTPVEAPKMALPQQASASPLDISGDLRLRYESNFGDRDARNRDRGVLRARLRGNYAITPWLTAGAQLTTGDPDDPNSSDATLSNFNDDLDVSLDQVWLRGKLGRLELTGGKIPQPFIRTDMVWDGDVYPEGVSAAYSMPIGKALDVKASGLYFIIDESVAGPDSRMIGGQITTSYRGTGSWKSSLSVGYYDYSLNSLAGADAGDFRTNRFANGRYVSDFNLLDIIVSAEYSGFSKKWPIRIMGDYVHNFGADQGSNGFSILTTVGRAADKGDWRFGYGYVRVGTDAVLAAFSEDNTTIATNALQHSLSIDYTIRPHLILNGTFYHYRPWRAVDAGANAPDDWLNRMRLNLLVEF